MKHVKLFEDFDLDRFLQDPDSEFAKNEDNPELEPGDWVESYRGNGQLLSIDGEFARVKLTGSRETIAKVPVFALKKIKKSSVNTEMPDTQGELRQIADQVAQYVNILDGDDDLDSEMSSVNPDAVVNFLQDILIDIISISRKDPDATLSPEYREMGAGISILAHSARTGQNDEQIDSILNKFQSLEGVRENQQRNYNRLKALGLASNNFIDVENVQPEEKDIMRANGLFTSYGFDEGKASRMAQLIKEPMKMVRRVKAVCQVFINHRDTRYYATTPEQIKSRLQSKLRYSFRQPMLNLGFTDAQIEQMIDQAIADHAQVTEKKRLEWHDSNAPDANGKFKELGINALADWLIKTRGKNLQKISGSLNQQIAFNKKKNPSYAAKMEKTREAVKRKLGKSDNK